jgi:hypothetical protein
MTQQKGAQKPGMEKATIAEKIVRNCSEAWMKREATFAAMKGFLSI